MSINCVKKFIKTLFYVTFALIVQGWQTAGIVVIAIWKNRPWECLFMLIGFWIGRHFFGKSYHAKSLWACTLITWALFYVMVCSIPSFHISITLPSMAGVILAYMLTFVRDYIDRLEGDIK